MAALGKAGAAGARETGFRGS